ncbi:MAG TPA: class I SAM-dependent methyltransferase [Bacilli bacterium]|nr:class I SAM-dependent methyltransferase [Bacilli bacterium]
MLEYTGERVIPELMKPMNGMLLEHLARYYFALPYIRQGTVLDIACGAGYGTHMVAKACKKDIDRVLGVDVDPQTVEYARRTYYHPQTAFEVHDALDPQLPDKLGTFDVVLSFETIEHVADDRLFVDILYRLLKLGGTLVLSTPFGAGRGQPTLEPFHQHQLTEDEFWELFTPFAEVERYYQRGVTFEKGRPGVPYPFGVAVCRK